MSLLVWILTSRIQTFWIWGCSLNALEVGEHLSTHPSTDTFTRYPSNKKVDEKISQEPAALNQISDHTDPFSL